MFYKSFLFILISLFCLTFTPQIASSHPNHSKKSLRVKRINTPISEVDLAKALREGHYLAFGKYPSTKRLTVAWAQVALENGRGKYTYNHNLGNISSRKKIPYYIIYSHSFLSFKSFNEGAAAYWRVIRNMCKSSLKYFDNGNAYAAGLQLRRCNYYMADKNKYMAFNWKY